MVLSPNGWRRLAALLMLSATVGPVRAQPAASYELGQYANEDVNKPVFTHYGPNGGPSAHGFRFWARGVGSTVYQSKRPVGLGFDPVRRWLFVPDTYNHRVLAYAINRGGTLAMRDAMLVLGQPDFSTTLSDNSAREDVDPPAPRADASNLLTPSSTAVDPVGRRLFVADQGHQRILVYSLDADPWNGMPASAVIGQADFGGDGANRGQGPTAGTLNEPAALLFDSNRTLLWVADNANHRVLAFDVSAGVESGMAARYVLGQPDFTRGARNGGGLATAQTLNSPRGLTLTTDGGMLFVADELNHRVLGYDLTGGISNGQAASLVLGQSDFAAAIANRNSVLALAATFYQPHDVAIDPVAGRLLVADARNGRVVAFVLSGLRNGQAAEIVLGAPALNHPVPDGLPPPRADALNFPTAVTVLDGRAFIVDQQNNRILAFDCASLVTGGAAIDVVGQYEEGDLARPSFVQQAANDGPTSFEFDQSDGVSGCAVDPVHRWLAVADALNGRVLIFQLDARHQPTSRKAAFVLGTANFHTIGGQAINQTTIRRPQRLLFDDRNRLFVADDQAGRVLVYDLSGGISNGMPASFVLGKTSFTTSGAGGGRSGLNRPRGLGYDRLRQWLFVGDTNNNRVVVFDLSAGVQTGMDAAYVLGQPDFSRVSANAGGAPGAAGMNVPRDPLFDSTSGLLFVADTGNVRVLVYDLATGIQSGMNAAFVLGQVDFSSAAVAVARNRVDSVGSLALDAARRRLFVANRTGTRTLVYDLSTGVRSGMDAVAILGQPDFDSIAALPGREFAAGGNITFDPVANTLYAVDANNEEHNLLAFPLTTGFDVALPAAEPVTSYRALAATGGVGPLSYSIVGGELPPGLSLDEHSGLITGTVAAGGSRTYAVALNVRNGFAATETGVLWLNTGGDDRAQLVNLSVRARSGRGADVLTAGFVLGGDGVRRLLIRGIGPTLANYAVPGALADPQLNLFDSATGRLVEHNDDWGGGAALAGTFARAGAFSLPGDSKDAVIAADLAAKSYTLQVTGAGTSTGVALAEVYDVDRDGSSTRLLNLSGRGRVGPGADQLLASFVIEGAGTRTVLIRAVGPSLGSFGVAGALANPQLRVIKCSTGAVLATNDDWGASAVLQSASRRVGAFPLPADSKDAAVLITLPAGAYTAEASGVNNAEGIALVEIYDER